MRRKRLLLLLGVAFLISLGDAAYADNDQAAVIGIGVGLHAFTKRDDFREASAPFSVNLDLAGMSQLYGEWYALGALGFGVRVITLSVRQEVGASGANPGYKELAVTNLFGTANLVLLGSTSRLRLAVMGGAGLSSYDASESYGDVAFSDSASGTATLLGGYLDFGGGAAGGRIGVNLISTQLGTLNGLAVDAGGTSLYLDFRWAFK